MAVAVVLWYGVVYRYDLVAVLHTGTFIVYRSLCCVPVPSCAPVLLLYTRTFVCWTPVRCFYWIYIGYQYLCLGNFKEERDGIIK